MSTMPPSSFAAARRAQRDAYRAQRQYWRALRRPSIVRPVVLIAIGIVALLLQTGKLDYAIFWTWYVRWWPVLLIAIGLLLLGEWYLNRDSPYGVRSSGGGIIGLVIGLSFFFAFAGHAFHHGGPFAWTASPDADQWRMHFFGHEHDAEHQLEEAVPADVALHINNPRGDVILTASADGRMHVNAHNVVYASSNHKADALQSRLQPRFELNGREATLSVAALEQGTSQLTIQAPAGASIDINAARGDVSTDGFNGAVTVNSGHGDVKINNVANAVTVRMDRGDLMLHGINGTVTMSGRLNDASITNVNGRVTLNGDFFGDVTLSAIQAPVSLHSSRTSFDVDRVDGEISLDSGDLHVSRSHAPLRVATRAKDIELTEIAGGGPVTVDNTDGDIDLSLAALPGDVDLHNRNGDIQIALPSAGAYAIDASAPTGEITSDWELGGNGTRADHSYNGHIGTASGHTPTIRLVSDHGNIQLKKAGAVDLGKSEDEPGTDKSAPEAPKAPKPPRLRVPQGGVAEPTVE